MLHRLFEMTLGEKFDVGAAGAFLCGPKNYKGHDLFNMLATPLGAKTWLGIGFPNFHIEFYIH